jgi:hypothetical protein
MALDFLAALPVPRVENDTGAEKGGNEKNECEETRRERKERARRPSLPKVPKLSGCDASLCTDQHL